LKTLKKHDFATGMAEVIKCGFIQDPKILEIIEKYPEECKNFEGIEIPELITRSIQVKADVVSKDFKETSSSKTGREILNYGHTLGHAIEKIENYKWRHGDAVSIGMIYAAELAFAQGILKNEIVQRHRNIVNIFKLPTAYKKKNFKKLIEIMAIDKKSRSGRLRFVVLEDIAKPTRLENPTFKVLNQAWEKISK
jgi:3-dehydroquinate synthase